MKSEFNVPGIPVSGLKGLGNEQKIKAVCLADCQSLSPDYSGSLAIDIVDYVVCRGLTDSIRRDPRRASLKELTARVSRALKDVAYQDGEQVVMLSATRRYGEADGLVISVSYWD
ncbi:hypothetical protein Q5O14_10305 [Eubacteriaceae bacterium ES2]|nr:hypothetical protein Q5O14_10305 [Eubacteriaceae bacterium ES2]